MKAYLWTMKQTFTLTIPYHGTQMCILMTAQASLGMTSTFWYQSNTSWPKKKNKKKLAFKEL